MTKDLSDAIAHIESECRKVLELSENEELKRMARVVLTAIEAVKKYSTFQMTYGTDAGHDAREALQQIASDWQKETTK